MNSSPRESSQEIREEERTLKKRNLKILLNLNCSIEGYIWGGGGGGGGGGGCGGRGVYIVPYFLNQIKQLLL